MYENVRSGYWEFHHSSTWMFFELKITNVLKLSRWGLKKKATMGTEFCITIGVLPVELSPHQLSMVCAANWLKSSSIYVLDVILGWVYDVISHLVCKFYTFFKLYYIHFEITGYPCNVIGSKRCDLFPNRTIFCSKSHLFLTQEEWGSKTKQIIWFQG